MPRFDEFSDADLLRASKRDAEAFRALYRRHVRAILAAVQGDLRDSGVAEEITAETFARAWFSRAKFRDERAGSALPWLRGIAANLVLAHRRGQRVERAALERLGITLEPRTDENEFDRVNEIDAAARARGALAGQLAALPSAQREAVELRVVEERSYREIAAHQDTSQTLARVRVARGIAKLRQAIRGGKAPE